MFSWHQILPCFTLFLHCEYIGGTQKVWRDTTRWITQTNQLDILCSALKQGIREVSHLLLGDLLGISLPMGDGECIFYHLFLFWFFLSTFSSLMKQFLSWHTIFLLLLFLSYFLDPQHAGGRTQVSICIVFSSSSGVILNNSTAHRWKQYLKPYHRLSTVNTTPGSGHLIPNSCNREWFFSLNPSIPVWIQSLFYFTLFLQEQPEELWQKWIWKQEIYIFNLYQLITYFLEFLKKFIFIRYSAIISLKMSRIHSIQLTWKALSTAIGLCQFTPIIIIILKFTKTNKKSISIMVFLRHIYRKKNTMCPPHLFIFC